MFVGWEMGAGGEGGGGYVVMEPVGGGGGRGYGGMGGLDCQRSNA